VSQVGAERPLVSVVIPTFNAAAFIRDCLRSVFSQQGDFDLDVVLVDDGSSDDTLARVETSGYPVRRFEQANAGPAAARNRALREARGEYIAFLDSDDLWPEGKLASQLEVMQAHPDIGLLFGNCRQFDERGEYTQTLFEEAQRDLPFWGDPLYVLQPYAKLMQRNFITTGSIVMRRACVDVVGYFDERLRLVEDLEYWLRIALEFPIAHVDSVCLLRRRHEENTSRDQVAMSLAFLGVLTGHRDRFLDAIKAQGADLDGRMTAEYQELGHLYMRRRAHGAAAHSYLRALRRRPGIRPAYYLASALAAAVGLRRGDQ
jgi:glycosyltransferase involved in cell wall biosynthesis